MKGVGVAGDKAAQERQREIGEDDGGRTGGTEIDKWRVGCISHWQMEQEKKKKKDEPAKHLLLFLQVQRLEVGVSSETSCINLFLFSVWLTANLSPSSHFYLRHTLGSLLFREEEARLTSICTSSPLESNYDKLCTRAAWSTCRCKHAHVPETDRKSAGANTWLCGPEYRTCMLVPVSVWPFASAQKSASI